MMPEHYDPQEVKRRLPMLDLLAHEGVAVRRNGRLWLAHCPFHQEKSMSFTIYIYDIASQDHAHCFGCGWNGDIIKFRQERHGEDFVSSLKACASLASVPPSVLEAKRKQAAKMPRVSGLASEPKEKPVLPRMRAMEDAEVQALAALRGLSVEGVKAAALVKRVGWCRWPQWIDRNGCWAMADDAGPSWVVTDKARRVAQFRRMDGGMFTRKDGREIKAWTKGSPTWPLGASEIGERGCVMLVEGGADMLAGFHFLTLFHRLDHVAVCAMLGASCAICDEALPFFRQKRVRIFMDEDEPKPVPGHPEKPPIYPGREAAARWTEQLIEAGAAVETFSLEGLMKRDGSRVKDLNDLAMVDEAAWLDAELREAYFDWDF